MSKTTVEPKRIKNDPCRKGYAMLGTKVKNGRQVPNCVKQRRKET